MEHLVGYPYTGRFGCFLLVREALKALGTEIPDYTEGLSEDGRLAALQAGLARHAVQVEQPQRGDVVIVRVMGRPDHVGIMVNPREMLHCMKGTNAVIERINGARWKGRVVGFWRP